MNNYGFNTYSGTLSAVTWGAFNNYTIAVNGRTQTLEDRFKIIESQWYSIQPTLIFFAKLKEDIDNNDFIRDEWNRFMAMYKLASLEKVQEIPE